MSTKGRYGLRAVIDIAIAGEKPIAVGTIAKREQISEQYLEQLMRKLKQAGIVRSVRGPSGGYVLDKPAEKLTASEVLRAVGEDVEPVECSALNGLGCCNISEDCRSKLAWKKLNEGITDILDGITIASLI